MKVTFSFEGTEEELATFISLLPDGDTEKAAVINAVQSLSSHEGNLQSELDKAVSNSNNPGGVS